ncbi:MAG: hypothetical protein ACI89J_000078 [Hyphomicrobiaceae bacterium]|jgi:hypothetical protein
MSTKPNHSDRIADLLAAYGSDLSRWPEDGRQAMAALSPEERAARLREDLAFDQVIAGAVQIAAKAPVSDALMARILSATTTEAERPSSYRDDSTVVDLRPVASSNDIDANHHPANRKRDWTAAAALMAASLVLGIFVGSTESGQSTAISIGDFAGFNVSSSAVQLTALDEALPAQDDEDIL